MAQAGEVESDVLIREAADALAAVAYDHRELVLACRQLLEHRPASGPLVWLAARMVSGADPYHDGIDASERIRRDKTPQELDALLPSGARIVVVGAPELTSRVLINRPDLNVMGASAVRDADLVVLEADALGPNAAVAAVGSLAAATAGASFGVPVWMVAGIGRKLPGVMWDLLADRYDHGEPWRHPTEVVPLAYCDQLVTPAGSVPITDAAVGSDCPVVPEVLR